jgi:MtrB/PioB family decaheme-associated outer membrane protein
MPSCVEATMSMRHGLLFVVLASLASSASPSAQQIQQPSNAPEPSTTTPGAAQSVPVSTENFADFSVRGTAYSDDSDQGRAQRYRDLRGGGTLEFLRFSRDDARRWYSVEADHVGYRDQRYSATFNDFGKVKAWFQYNQIPLFFSDQTKAVFSPEAGVSENILRMPDSIQSGLQNKTLQYANVDALASPFELRLKRSVTEFNTTYAAMRHLDVNVAFRSTMKDGNQPWAGTFGFSDAVELAVPVRTRTTDFGLGLEWANGRGSARVGYDGSFFRNEFDTLVWDNPLRVTDSPTLGPLQGRESLWPDSNQNTGSISGALNLPARCVACAFLSIGQWTQDNVLIPFTVNSALPLIPLDRQTSDARARVTSMNYTFSSRPTDMLWVSARYRSYDFDNRTPVLHVANTVSYDTAVAAFAEGGTSPYSLNRKTFDADASVTPLRYTAFRVGYTREAIEQTFRFVDTTTENTVRVSADASGINWLMLRAVYEHGKRTGSGFDEQALDDIGEQVSLRQFDISDRTSNRASLIAQVTPVSSFSLNGSVSAGNEDRPGTGFGLRSNDNRSYSVGVDYVPRPQVSVGAQYTREKYTSLQASRQANPGAQFDDPTRDWTTDGSDRANTFTASMDLLKLVQKTDVRLSYDFSHAESLYVYGLPPNTTLAPVQQLPAVVNELQRATADVRYHFTRHLGAGIVYWFDKYTVNDFAMGTQTLTTIAQPSFLMIGYLAHPYMASTLSGRFTYYW